MVTDGRLRYFQRARSMRKATGPQGWVADRSVVDVPGSVFTQRVRILDAQLHHEIIRMSRIDEWCAVRRLAGLKQQGLPAVCDRGGLQAELRAQHKAARPSLCTAPSIPQLAECRAGSRLGHREPGFCWCCPWSSSMGLWSWPNAAAEPAAKIAVSVTNKERDIRFIPLRAQFACMPCIGPLPIKRPIEVESNRYRLTAESRTSAPMHAARRLKLRWFLLRKTKPASCPSASIGKRRKSRGAQR